MNERDHKGGVVLDLGTSTQVREEIDPLMPVELYRSYLEAFRAVGKVRLIAVRARGMITLADRVAIGFHVDDEPQSLEVVNEISHEVGKSQVPAMKTLAKRVASVPREISMVVRLVRAGSCVPLLPVAIARPRTHHEVTTRRVKIEKTGGIKAPTVRVLDLQTYGRYTLDTDMETAKVAGHALYGRADVRMRLLRRADNGVVVGGRILAIRALADGPTTIDQAQAWWNGRYAGPS